MEYTIFPFDQKLVGATEDLVKRVFELDDRELLMQSRGLPYFGYVIIKNHKVVAAILGYDHTYDREEGIYVWALVVDENHQRNGYGTILLNKFIETYKSKKIGLRIEHDKEYLINFYRKIGFKQSEYRNFLGNWLYFYENK